MANKMQRFSRSARLVMSYAQAQALAQQSSAIGTEHLLFGLIDEVGGIAGKLLRDLGIDEPKVQALANQPVLNTFPQLPDTPLELSNGVKRTREIAAAEASRLQHSTIDTHHLLIGLLRQNEGGAATVLQRLNINPDDVLQRVQQEIDRGASDTPAS